MHRYPFAVADKAFCCWEHDIPERNERFLSRIDDKYFVYVADRHVDQLEGEDRQRAAVALRGAYHHAMETLFSLLGAMVQAPECVPAWLPKCTAGDLRVLVRAFLNGAPLVTQCGTQRLMFSDLSKIVHQFCWADEVPAGMTASRFATLWTRLAVDFLDEHSIAEYNSLKHGFRVAAGGFTLRFGREEEFGVRAPEANMRSLGGSVFGTSYFEPLPVVSSSSSAHHFRIRHKSLNWSAEAMVQRLYLLSFSIANVVGALRCLNGSEPGAVAFSRPTDSDGFELAWRSTVGVTSSNMDLEVASEDVEPLPRSDLMNELKGRHLNGAA